MVVHACSPATQEPEAGEWLEPERQMLQFTETVPLHSSLGNRAKLSLKTNKQIGEGGRPVGRGNLQSPEAWPGWTTCLPHGALHWDSGWQDAQGAHSDLSIPQGHLQIKANKNHLPSVLNSCKSGIFSPRRNKPSV